MEKWFVLGWIMTVLWGNGAVEQRTEWSHVFYGTAEQCRTEAAAFLRPEVDRAANLPASVRAPSAKHGIMPDLYNGGIVSMKPMSAFCAPFTSEEHIKKASPAGM